MRSTLFVLLSMICSFLAPCGLGYGMWLDSAPYGLALALFSLTWAVLFGRVSIHYLIQGD